MGDKSLITYLHCDSPAHSQILENVCTNI